MENMNKQQSPLRKEEKKGGITSVDTAILILVVVTLFGTVFGWVYRNIVEDRAGMHDTNYVVSFRIEQTHRQVTEGLAAGDAIYTMSDGTFLGYLRGDLAVSNVQNDTGLDQVVGTGSMLCAGTETEDSRSLSVNGGTCRLTPGDVLQVRTERECLTIFIVAIFSE